VASFECVRKPPDAVGTYEVLHATAAGRPLYETNGWTATTEMSKVI